jgi:rhodanese-related sulfurtransferase
MDAAIDIATLTTLKTAFPPPLVIDVRREPTYAAADSVIAGAIRRDPAQIALWANEIEIGRRIVVYCAHGLEIGQETAQSLRRRGLAVQYLAGGIAAWADQGGRLAPKPPAQPTRWVTRERPKIDRIACPWLIRRFIDPDAQFLYVPPGEVLSQAAREKATPYDIPGVHFSHEGERCSFDAFIAEYSLAGDPALMRLAEIVRGADTSRLDLTAQSSGLFAVSLGLSHVFADDHAMLRHGLVLYDALYAWCRSLQGETHAWPPAMPQPVGAAA